MKIIVDHFRRRWLIWALACLVFVATGAMLTIAREIGISAILVASISITTLDWGLGCPRVLASLPFTARQIGRAYWWLSVAAPTLLIAVFSGIGILIVSRAGTHAKYLGTWFALFVATGPQDQFLGIWLEMVLAGGLLCGSFFWVLSGATWANTLVRAGEPRLKRFSRQFCACAFALALFGGIYFLFYKSNISLAGKGVIAYLFGLLFSVLGWFRAESLFIDTASRWGVAGAGISRGKSEPRSGYGGVPYLIIRFCLFYLSMAALFIAFSIGMTGIMVWLDGDHWSDIVSPALWEIQLLLPICFFQTMLLGTHLKLLRSLPLTSKQFAATILGLAILPVLIFGGLWILFLLMEPGVLSAMSVLKFLLLDLSAVCVLTTGVIWYNEKHFKRITGVVLAWIVSMLPLIYQLATASTGGLPIWIIIFIPVLSIFIALFIIRRLLEKNEMTYRIKFELPAGW
jgi:hypothetical protein